MPGATKTRLCPPLAPHTAAALYTCFLHDLLEQARGLPDVHPVIAFTPASAGPFFARFAPDFAAEPQRGDELGERMDRALSAWHARAQAAGQAVALVLIGSDSPDLPAAYLLEAFARLEAGAELVLGPADDGGYYLVGVRQPQPRLLREVPMSTPTVLADTLALAATAGLRAELLPHWYDIDTVAELHRLARALQTAPPATAPRTRAFLAQLEWQTDAQP